MKLARGRSSGRRPPAQKPATAGPAQERVIEPPAQAAPPPPPTAETPLPAALTDLVERLDRIADRLAESQTTARPLPASREIFSEWVRLRRWEEIRFEEFLKLRRTGRI